ncbi:MAG: CPBP family intramembrane metalloprotease [Gammaproteobacteria bacterium]|nr:CPBP family intramembrane metalloprotease [Gammaproteobacteria bacterium]
MGKSARYWLHLALYLVLVVGFTGAICPLLFWSFESFGWEVEFESVVLRVLKFTALGMLFWLLWALRIPSAAAWGFVGPAPQFFRRVCFGFALGVAMLALLVIVVLALGVRIPKVTLPSASEFALWLLVITLLAFVTSVVEESLFRGGLYSSLARRMSARVVIPLTACIFAAVHFLEPSAKLSSHAVDWGSGFEVLADMVMSDQGEPWLDSFMALFAAGVLLGVCRRAGADIAVAIGMHAGWVVVIRATRRLSDVDRDAPYANVVGHYDGVIGYASTLLFGVLLLIYVVMQLRHRNALGAKEAHSNGE